jgi:hypothetical protein
MKNKGCRRLKELDVLLAAEENDPFRPGSVRTRLWLTNGHCLVIRKTLLEFLKKVRCNF